MAVFGGSLQTGRHFGPIDALAGPVPCWGLDVTRLSTPPATASVQVTAAKDMLLTRFALNGASLARGSAVETGATIGMIIAASGEVRVRGCLPDFQTMTPVWMQGKDVQFVSTGALDLMSVTVADDLFHQSLRSIAGVDTKALSVDTWLRALKGSPTWSERGRAIAALQAALANGAVLSREACHRLQESVLQILFRECCVDSAAAPVSAPTRRRVARAAEELLRLHLDDPPSIRVLCERIGACERTLHHAFQESFGTTPKNYLRALRLNVAHRRLLGGQAMVTEVAADLGLFHFGRFSADYRAMFGETPSATLRNARCGKLAGQPAGGRHVPDAAFAEDARGIPTAPTPSGSAAAVAGNG